MPEKDEAAAKHEEKAAAIKEEEDDPEKKAEELLRKNARRIHPVRGYSDTENMWEKLLNLEKTAVCPPHPPQYQNNKHRFSIAIQDKIFKIKKNPCYMPYNQ